MKICLAGTGAMGEIHVKALAKIDGVEVVSIAGAHGRERARRSPTKWKIPFCVHATWRPASIGRASTRSSLTTPSDQHRDQTLLALSKGKHVQVEIPMALNLADAAAACSTAAKKAGKVCMVTHTRRFSSPHREIRRRIQEGTFHLHHMVVETYFFRRTNLNMHGQPRSWVDNLLWHHGCHSVDLAQLDPRRAELGGLGPEGTRTTRSSGSRWTLPSAMKSKKGPLFTMAMSFNNKGPVRRLLPLHRRGRRPTRSIATR